MHRFSVVFIEGPVKWLIFGTTRFYNRGTIGDDFAEMRQIRRRNGEGRWNPLDMSNGFHRPLPFPLWILRIFAKSSPIVPRIKKRVLAIFAIFPPKKEIFKNKNIKKKLFYFFGKNVFRTLDVRKALDPTRGCQIKATRFNPDPLQCYRIVPSSSLDFRDDRGTISRGPFPPWNPSFWRSI